METEVQILNKVIIIINKNHSYLSSLRAKLKNK